MNPLRTSLLTLLLGFTLLTGCNSNPNQALTEDKDTLDLTVSILPQEYFVKKIAGDRVKVSVMVQPGSEPENYEPLPQQLKDLSQGQAYIAIGVPFEQTWLSKLQAINPKIVIIDSAKGITMIPMIAHEHEHEHEDNLDPHIWLSPQLVKIQAQNIYQGLIELDPENQIEYQENLEKFLAEIDTLDAQIRQNLAGIQNRRFIVFHPAWGYFAQDYNLEQIPIEVGGQEPSASELGKLVKKAQTENIRIIFAQYQFNAQSAQTIAQEIDGEVLFLDPLDPNWSDNLLTVSQKFATALK